MNKSLVCCLAIFKKLEPFLLQQTSDVSLDFRESITAQFIQFEREAVSHHIDIKTIDDIKYALAGLVDECVMYSSWEGKLAWMQRSLQLQFFGEHRAGEGFFERLSQLRQAGQIEIDALEIYALCLQCGFQGVYRFRDHTQFVALKAGLESQITTLRGPCSLSISSLFPVQDYQRYSREKPLWWIVIVALTIIFFMWMGYHVAEMRQIHHAITTLQQDSVYDG